MLAKQDDMYNRAYQQLEVLSMDEATRQQYESREMWLRDEATRQYEAEQRGEKRGEQRGEQRGWTRGKKEGLQEGEIRGEIQNKLSNATALIGILDDTTIANTLSLPLEIVQRLRAGEDAESIKAEVLAERMAIRV